MLLEDCKDTIFVTDLVASKNYAALEFVRRLVHLEMFAVTQMEDTAEMSRLAGLLCFTTFVRVVTYGFAIPCTNLVESLPFSFNIIDSLLDVTPLRKL